MRALRLVVLLLATSVHAEGPVLDLAPGERKAMAELLGPGVVGAAVPSAPIDDPTVLFPLQEKTLSFAVVSGKRAGKRLPLRIGKHARPNGTVAWRFELSPTLAAFLRHGDDGNLTMPAVTDTERGVVTFRQSGKVLAAS